MSRRTDISRSTVGFWPEGTCHCERFEKNMWHYTDNLCSHFILYSSVEILTALEPTCMPTICSSLAKHAPLHVLSTCTTRESHRIEKLFWNSRPLVSALCFDGIAVVHIWFQVLTPSCRDPMFRATYLQLIVQLNCCQRASFQIFWEWE